MNEQEVFKLAKEIKNNGLNNEKLSLLEKLTMKYIVFAIKKYAHKDTNLEEVYYMAFNCILKIINENDLENEGSFIKVLKNKINSTIRYAIVEQGTSYIPPHFMELINNYMQTKELLEKERQREPLLIEIAEAMKISLEKVKQIKKVIHDKNKIINNL